MVEYTAKVKAVARVLEAIGIRRYYAMRYARAVVDFVERSLDLDFAESPFKCDRTELAKFIIDGDYGIRGTISNADQDALVRIVLALAEFAAAQQTEAS